MLVKVEEVKLDFLNFIVFGYTYEGRTHPRQKKNRSEMPVFREIACLVLILVIYLVLDKYG